VVARRLDRRATPSSTVRASGVACRWIGRYPAVGT